MSTLSSANVTDVNLVLEERTHMRLCINMLIFTHHLGNWLIVNMSLTTNMTVNLTCCTTLPRKHHSTSVHRDSVLLGSRKHAMSRGYDVSRHVTVKHK